MGIGGHGGGLARRLRAFLEETFHWSLVRKVQLAAFSALLQAATWILIGLVLLFLDPADTGVPRSRVSWLLGLALAAALIYQALVSWGTRLERRGAPARNYLIVTCYAHGLLAGPALYLIGPFSGFSWLLIVATSVTAAIAFDRWSAYRLVGSVVGSMGVLTIGGWAELIPYEPILAVATSGPPSDRRLLAMWTLHVVAGACALLQLGILSTLLRDREERFRRLSTVDPLTGIANRRHFLEKLADEWNRSRRHGNSFALALVDLDHFKRINDVYGHPTGDRVLVRIAALLHDSLRVNDLVARYGGEEFVVLLPMADDDGARTVMERCRATIAIHPLESDDGTAFHVTASVGLAVLPDAALDSPDALIAAADHALYEAKQRGRDRVILHRRSAPPEAQSDAPPGA